MSAPTNIAFTVPGEPQGKGRPRATTINGMARMYTPAKTAAYEGLVALAAQRAMGGMSPMLGACAVEIVATHSIPASWSKRKQADALAGFYRPHGKPDADNIAKALFDGMNGVVWKDDAQVCTLLMRRLYGATPGVSVNVAQVHS